MDEAEEILGMTLVPDDEATVVVEPREQALDLPAASIPAERTAILTLAFAVREIRRDEFDPALLEKAFVQAVAVVGFLPTASAAGACACRRTGFGDD